MHAARGDGRDGRREPRVAVELAARLGGRSAHAVGVVDLSRVGCLIRSEAPLDAGAVVDLRVELPDGLLRAKARVVESSLDGVSAAGERPRFLTGLEFMGIAAADDVRLRAFVGAAARRGRGAHASSA